jgi:hypothetical protein
LLSDGNEILTSPEAISLGAALGAAIIIVHNPMDAEEEMRDVIIWKEKL